MTKMTIGNQLKKARQKKQVTLKEVYQQTRIHPDILAALEEDRFDQILNPAYIRSFLKEYAAFLGLDVKKILLEYDKLHPEEKLEVSKPPSTKIKPSVEKKPLLPGFDFTKLARIIGIGAASILAVVILVFFLRGAARAISNISQKRTERAKKVEAAKPVKVARPKERISKREIQKAPTKPISPPSKKVSVPAGEKLKLTITATEDVWIQLKVDGKVIFQNVLKKGSSEQWQADNNFTIWTGKAAAMQLNLNGNDLGPPGEGVKKDIVVTREGIKR